MKLFKKITSWFDLLSVKAQAALATFAVISLVALFIKCLLVYPKETIDILFGLAACFMLCVSALAFYRRAVEYFTYRKNPTKKRNYYDRIH